MILNTQKNRGKDSEMFRIEPNENIVYIDRCSGTRNKIDKPSEITRTSGNLLFSSIKIKPNAWTQWSEYHRKGFPATITRTTFRYYTRGQMTSVLLFHG